MSKSGGEESLEVYVVHVLAAHRCSHGFPLHIPLHHRAAAATASASAETDTSWVETAAARAVGRKGADVACVRPMHGVSAGSRRRSYSGGETHRRWWGGKA